MCQFVDKDNNCTLAERLLANYAAKSGRPLTATGKYMVSKVREIIESDGKYINRDVAKAVDISLSSLLTYFESAKDNCQMGTLNKNGYSYKRSSNC